MGVGGDDVHPSPIEKFASDALRSSAKSAGKRSCGHLHQATHPQPRREFFRLLHQCQVAFRMGENRHHAGDGHLIKAGRNILRNAEIRKLHQ